MEKIGYVDVSNLVHRTINGYFNNIKEIVDIRKAKKQFKSDEEYKEAKEQLINEIVESKGEDLQYLLLSMVYNVFEKMRNNLNIEEHNFYAMLDSSSWRKEFVKEFYKENEDKTVKGSLYKGGRESSYTSLVFKTIQNFKNLLEELNFNVFKYENKENYRNSLEADDIIALIIRRNKEALNIVCSNDIDFYQLQKQENVEQYNPITQEMINLSKEEAKKELLHKKISGDGSDNIPKIINFDISDTNNNKFSFPKIGDVTFKNIIDAYDIDEITNNPEILLKDLGIKLYTYSITKLPIKPKMLSELKEITKSPNAKITIEETEELIEKIIKEAKEDYKKEIEKNDLKIAKILNKKEEILDLEKIMEELNNKDDKELKPQKDEEEIYKLIKKNILTKRKLKELNSEKINDVSSLTEIIKKLKKQFEHNQTIIDFDYIPKHLEERFIDEVRIKIKSMIKTGEERKEIFKKYKLNHLASRVEQAEIKEKKRIETIEKKNNQPTLQLEEKQNIIYSDEITKIVTTNNGQYIKISGYIPNEVKEKLEKTIDINIFLSKLEFDDKEEWILKLKDENEENKKYIVWNHKLINFLKETSRNIEETKIEKKNKKNIQKEIKKQ
jgi:hypothetical protein